MAGLELANALVAGDEQFLDALCLAGALPLVCRLALHTWPRAIRLQAALFLQQCCQAGRPTATMLVACQACPLLCDLFLSFSLPRSFAPIVPMPSCQEPLVLDVVAANRREVRKT